VGTNPLRGSTGGGVPGTVVDVAAVGDVVDVVRRTVGIDEPPATSSSSLVTAAPRPTRVTTTAAMSRVTRRSTPASCQV
jgi:hypothetical protein